MLNFDFARGGDAFLHARAALDTTSVGSSNSRRDEEELVQACSPICCSDFLKHLLAWCPIDRLQAPESVQPLPS